MSDLISIIVPVYNVEKYLDRCIQSIVEQTYRNLEIILVDDGSTDGSEKICDSWAVKDNRIRVIRQNNMGGGAARNAALDVAKGDFIAFVDSDDYIEPNAITTMVNALLPISSRENVARVLYASMEQLPVSCNPTMWSSSWPMRR